MMRRLAAAVLLVLPLAACSTHKMYTSPQFSTVAADHRTVAVLPFYVSISRERLPRNLTPEDVSRMEREESVAVQGQLYTNLLRRSDRYTVEFQDVARTNALLEQAGLTYDSLPGRTREQVAEVLGVDAVISGRIHRSKPMATGTAIALGVLFGGAFMGNTNEVSVDLQLHDGDAGMLLWNFSHKFGGSIGSTPERLAEAMMGPIARRFPYQRAEGAAAGTGSGTGTELEVEMETDAATAVDAGTTAETGTSAVTDTGTGPEL